LGALVGVRILTGVLSPEVYGELALGMTVAVLVNQIALGPLSNASLRFFASARDAGELPSFLAALKKLLLKATMWISLIAGIVCVGFILVGQFNRLWLIIAAFSFALFSGYNSTLDGMHLKFNEIFLLSFAIPISGFLIAMAHF
jgi:O-antigen/teichoic acid export membrane protein